MFTDASLSVDNVTKVMELVAADRMMKVWEKLGISGALVELIFISTPSKKTQACVDLFLNCRPEIPSWKEIVRVVYNCEEMAAAREAKQFCHRNGKYC